MAYMCKERRCSRVVIDLELAIDPPPPGGVLFTIIFENYMI